MADEEVSLTDALGVSGSDTANSGAKGGDDTAKSPDYGAEISAMKAQIGGNSQALQNLQNSIASLQASLTQVRPESQASVDKAVKLQEKAKLAYDQLLASGLKPGEIEGVNKIVAATYGATLDEVEELKTKLGQYETQFNRISQTANNTAFVTALSQLEGDPSLNVADSPQTFKEWKQEVLMPTLNNPNLSQVVRQALANDPFVTMKSLYLENLGEAYLSPDKAEKRKEARAKADKRKEDSSIPKGAGSGAKTPERKVQGVISDRMTDTLLKKVRV